MGRQINMGLLLTNRKLPSIHSESEPRSRSKATAYTATLKKKKKTYFIMRELDRYTDSVLSVEM